MVTTDNWLLLMYKMTDYTGIGKVPQENHNPFWAYFAAGLIIISNFLILNFFAGVLMDTFADEKRKSGGLSLLTDTQQQWVELQSFIMSQDLNLNLMRPQNKFRGALYGFWKSKLWNILDMVLVICGAVAFLMVHHRQSKAVEQAAYIIQTVTFSFFALEILLKIITYGFQFYRSASLLINILILACEIAGMILTATMGEQPIFQGMKAVRIVKILKIFMYLNNSSVVSDILWLSLPYLMNTLVILLVVFYIYSIIGLHLLPFIKRRIGINLNSNFSSLGMAMFTLMSISTGENWTSILEDCVKISRPSDICFPITTYQEWIDHDKQFAGCGTNVAFVYFITFVILFGYALMNLLTGIIIESFYLRARLANSLVKSKDVQKFFRIWGTIDSNSFGMLHWKEAKMVLYVLGPPLGLPKNSRKDRFIDELWISLRLPLYRDKVSHLLYVHVYDMALALTKLAIQLDDEYLE